MPDPKTDEFGKETASKALNRATGPDPEEALDMLIRHMAYVKGVIYQDRFPDGKKGFVIPVQTGNSLAVDGIVLDEDMNFIQSYGTVHQPIYASRIGEAVGIWEGAL